jgi:hypothetical protein
VISTAKINLAGTPERMKPALQSTKKKLRATEKLWKNQVKQAMLTPRHCSQGRIRVIRKIRSQGLFGVCSGWITREFSTEKFINQRGAFAPKG